MATKYQQIVRRVASLPADGHEILLLEYKAVGRWRPPFYHLAHRRGHTVHVLGRVSWLTGRLCFRALLASLRRV